MIAFAVKNIGWRRKLVVQKPYLHLILITEQPQ
jgi:hypothetical protein